MVDTLTGCGGHGAPISLPKLLEFYSNVTDEASSMRDAHVQVSVGGCCCLGVVGLYSPSDSIATPT